MMLVELPPSEFQLIAPYAVHIPFPLLLAVVRNRQDGKVFANPREPSGFVVVTRFGFMGVCGDVDSAEFNSGLEELLAREGPVPPYLLWYAPPDRWQARLGMPSAPKRRRERVRFKLNRKFAQYLRAEEAPASGLEIRPLDAELISASAELGLNIESKFWSSAADFLTNGIGMCVLDRGHVVSVCYSACVVDGLAESDVATIPKYQGRGFAGMAGRAFVRACIKKGIEPSWDCFLANTASINLAKHLGFESDFTYPLYSFNVPLKIEG